MDPHTSTEGEIRLDVLKPVSWAWVRPMVSIGAGVQSSATVMSHDCKAAGFSMNPASTPEA